MIILDRLTKSVYLVVVRSKQVSTSLVTLYVREVIRLHGVPVSIGSDKDPLFTNKFWRGLRNALGTELNVNTVCHP